MVISLSGYRISQDPKWVAPPEADTYQNPLRENTKATEKGNKIYQKLCWTCHGKTGKGDGPAAAALTVAPSDYSDELVQSQSDGALYWKISNGRGEMVSYQNTLTDDQRWMLVNYIRQLGHTNTVP
jgi:mono/diheme cytochrome c family protein